jgi:hypothetical protein
MVAKTEDMVIGDTQVQDPTAQVKEEEVIIGALNTVLRFLNRRFRSIDRTSL